ncbi:MAG TPA: hypothetical protein VFO11_02995 [Candidatus Polarisedimenticolaceae bacterium]|nr:hypothetical protein [Candidatus Polarisedimenticolaceae bacterium]
MSTSRFTASRTTRLLLAALAWTLVGAGLLVAGAVWLASASPARCALGLSAAILLGRIKARYVLAPRAAANARRIEASPDRAPLVACFAPSAWALVLGMIALGALLRRSPLPRPWLGALYATIGVALLSASWAAWQEWRQPTS